MDAIILGGGRGERLRSEVADLPKILAPVNGRPFIAHLLDYLCRCGVARFILATGYLHEKIEDAIGDAWDDHPVTYSREETPLGTGGAARLALRHVEADHAFLLNGDTLFEVPLPAMMRQHTATASPMTLAVKPVENAGRYGTVRMAADGRITEFVEKRVADRGLINGGVYALRTDLLEEVELPQRFSLEEDFLKEYVRKIRIHGFESDAYFIDIGIPEDFRRAQHELR